MAYLGDDGTMDTVIVCDKCGKETRFNYDATFDDNEDADIDDATAFQLYRDYVDECIADVDDDCAHCADSAIQDELTNSDCTAGDESPSYRSAMIDSGRGHLLR